MAKIMNDNFQINVGNPIDSKYLASTNQPYASASAVNTAIPQSQRYDGLTVNVNNVEYWYCGGTGDGNLVIKDSGIASTGLTDASNGLSKVGSTVALGGTLTGDTTFVGSTSAVLQYGGDYSDGFDAQSIPDAGFVTGLTCQSITSASNGLTKTDQDVKLGGTTPLSETTNICGADQNLNLGTAASKIGSFTVNTGDAAILASGTTDICPTGALTLDGGSILVKEVAAYDASKAPFTALQIPDAQWVTGLTSQAILTADNGLTKEADDNVKLGGALTESTNIDATGYVFNVTGSSSEIRFQGTDNTMCMCTENAEVQLLQNTATVSASGDSIVVSTTGMVVTSTNDGEGLTYAGNYCDSFVNRSLVDKEYVDNSTGAIGGANGLSKDGDNIVLGGTLTGATAISANTNNFAIHGESSLSKFDYLYNANGDTFRMLTNTGDFKGNISAQAFTTFGRVSLTALSGSTARASLIDMCHDDMTLRLCTSGGLNSLVFNNNGSTVYSDGINSKGLEYGGAYKTNFTCHSLTDVDYVTGLTSQALINASNGLTDDVSGNVCLGGTLSTDTIINLNNGNCIEFCDNGNNTSYVFDFLGVLLNSQGSCLYITNSGSDYKLVHTSGSCVDLSLSGLTYGGNYESNFKSNTLVTKNYVDNATGGISANNGLSRQGDNIVLGGALTGDTTISSTGDIALCMTADFLTDCQSYIKFEAASSHIPTVPTEGTMYYSGCSLNFTREIAGVTLQIGEELFVRVENATGAQLDNGTVVYVNGATGDHPTIDKSDATTYASTNTIGVLTHDLANNSEGYVTVRGIVRNINTSSWSAGDELYLDATTPGTLTNVEPDHPNYVVKVGYVTKVGTTDGEILVDVYWEADHVTIDDFTGYTATTNNTLNSKLDTSVFNTYTGDTEATLTGLTEITNVAVTGATNGITKVPDHDVKLGGSLTEATCIDGAFVFTLCPAQNICLATTTTKDIGVNAMSNGGIYMKSQSGTVEGSDMTNAVGIALDYNASVPMLVTDNRPTPRGLQYADDYTSSFCDRSLVDKYYVDTIATGLNVHASVSMATTSSDGNLSLSGLTGTVDSIPLSGITGTTEDNRILVKNQTDASENGIYSATTGAWGRTSDYDFTPSGEISNGDLVPVTSGVTNANSQWINVSDNPIVSGDSINFSLFSQATGVVEGDGICVTTLGANKQVAVKLSPSNCGLEINATALELDYDIFTCGLDTTTAGEVRVCALDSTPVGDSISVRFDTDNSLVVDKADFSYTTASNGLTKDGCNVVLGGTMTGNTIINGAGIYSLAWCEFDDFSISADTMTFEDCSGSGYGIQYADDYKATFLDNSLVSKLYVNDAITGGTTLVNATNGLTKSGNDICWGSTTPMTADAALLRSNTNFCVKSTGVDIIADCGCVLTTTSAVNARACVSSSGCDASLQLANTGVVSIVGTAASQGVVITAPADGAVYAACYSTGFTSDCSLVDKGYVDACVSTGSIQTANNGLTKDGTNVRLGGALTGDTTISGAHTLCLSSLTAFNTTATNINMTGAVCVTGAIDGSSTLDIAGASVLASTLNVSGATWLDSTLRVDGATTLNSTLGVVGVSTLADALNVSGATWLDSTLRVDGVVTLNSVATGSVATDCILVLDTNGVVKEVASNTVGITTANNGLSVDGANFVLGGSLTGATCIDGDNTLTLDISDLQVLSPSYFTGSMCANTIHATGATCLDSTLNVSGATWLDSTLRVDGTLTLNSVGAGDSSDAILVLDSTGAVQCIVQSTLNTTAGNGITATGNYVELGGALTGNTEICGESLNSLTLGTAGSPLTSLDVNASTIGLTGAVTATGAVVGTSTLNISGATWLDSTLRVDGALTLNSVGAGATDDAILVLDSTGVVQCVASSTYDVTANNGLTSVGNNVALGGTLTGLTSVDGCTTCSIGFSHVNASDSACIKFNGEGTIDLKVYSGQTFSENETGVQIGCQYVRVSASAPAGSQSMEFENGCMLVSDSYNSQGLVYGGDYESNFTARSLVTCQYVDSVTSGITGAVTSANNGLTKDGQNVRLGGALTGDTTISGAHTLALSSLTAFNVGATTIGLTGAVTATGAVVGTSTLNISGATWLDSTLRVDGAVTLNSVATGSNTDDVLTITSGGEIQKISSDELGQDNNIYEMTVVTSNVTLTTGSTYVQLINNASSGLTITLPATPLDGQVFRIKDAAGAALTYPITIDRNGKLIDGAANDGILNTDGGALELVYNNSLGSWFVFSFVN